MEPTPNPAIEQPTDSRRRSWSRFARVIILVVVLLLLGSMANSLNRSAEANEERACWARVSGYSTMLISHLPLDNVQDEAAHAAIGDCNKRFPHGDDN
tara:strand:+ start:432 stop:725 length:294 start_codon:yes stop_codon:yes gene_type:complete